jgi:hypothetical protein
MRLGWTVLAAFLLACVSRPARAEEPAASTRGTAGAALLGAGAATLVTGSVLRILLPEHRSIVAAHCEYILSVERCDPRGAAARDTAFALSHGSSLAFAMSAVATGLGASFLLLGEGGRARRPARQPLSLSLVVSPAAPGLALGGSW